MDEADSQVPAQEGAQVPAQESGLVGNESTQFKKGRSGRYVPIGEHKAVLERLAALEVAGGPSGPVSAAQEAAERRAAAAEAELAEARAQLADRGEKAELKGLRVENAELRGRVAEFEAAAGAEETDEGSDRAEELLQRLMKSRAEKR